jgi:diguanylate cyclase (GGDEF)-like protein/PAS domain S-box-containing protein
MWTVLGCIETAHDPTLLVLAGLVCLVTCFTSLNLQSRAGGGLGTRWSWSVAAGLVFGVGVWATQFVAMLAFRPGVPTRFLASTTALSIAIAAAGSVGGFLLLGRRAYRVHAGLLLGLTVALMHFVGAHAMLLAGTITIDPEMAGAAIIIGIALSALVTLGLHDLRLLRFRLLGTFGLTAAVLALHFTGMAAMVITLGGGAAAGGLAIAPSSLAIVVTPICALILPLCLASSLLDQHLCARTSLEIDRLRQFAGTTFEGIVIHRNGVIIDANPVMCRLANHTTESLAALPIDEILGKKGEDPVPEIGIEIETQLHRKDGGVLPVEILSRVIEVGGAPATVTAVRDLTARKFAEDRIRHLAHHDQLTGLPNRALFNDRLSQAQEQATRYGIGFAVHSLDLDRFKIANELLGHAGGDQLLIQVANRLRLSTRSVDTVARLGGDELAVLQPRVSKPEDAAGLAAKLVEVMAVPFNVDGQTVDIGVSIGVAMCPDDGHTSAILMRHADMALYRAKHDGRGTFRFFDVSMDQRLRERRSMELDLRQAIARNEMHLDYQPLVDFSINQTVGYEALARWHHPVRGVVPPTDFIPLAEETGQIAAIGRWAIETACAEAATWTGGQSVSVNLSPAQFRQPELPRMIAAILARHGLPGNRLELEVTEGLLIEDTKCALAMLTALKSLGIRIALDDFGTGYSSVSYLRKFPFDKIKIDRSFVQGVGRDADCDEIIGVFISLARRLHLEVIAEGIETPDQLEFLRSQGCHLGQGFLLGRPASMDKAVVAVA